MKRLVGFLFCGLGVWQAFPPETRSQGDWAVYETFSRYSPAVFAINVEIPKEYILHRMEELMNQFRELQESSSEIIAGGSDSVLSQQLFSNLTVQWQRKLFVMQKQMLANNRVRGAGFAIDPHHVVTLASIVKSATLGGEITIEDDFRKVAKAQLVGVDEMMGVAVLRVNDVTFSSYVDLNRVADQLPVASYIMTIQRPYDLPASPFSGMIGGYYRKMNLFEYERYIQTDLPFYPGNEGSPVFSPSGQLIGMIATEFHIGNFPGITLVTPAEIVVDSALSLIKTGKRERGWIPGMVLKQDEEGVLIEELDANSLAAESGLAVGDLIIGVGGERESQLWKIYYKILDTKPQDTIRLEVKRGSQLYLFDVPTSSRKPR
ncbi:MAG: serine protease [Candidatus Omnitrophica bacterium]|nr:serine protease [Candidatus Omnitrophota bacterium]